jgi:hypothetical protein
VDHTASTPGTQNGQDDTLQTGSVANPRRTRLGADGRPVSGPVATTAD